MRNKQGHTPLHKAAFSGHERFCRWLVETVGLLDSQPDESGNYAADLAEMGESLHNTCQLLQDPILIQVLLPT